MDDSGQALVVEIVSDDLAVGPLLSEAGERDTDDVGLDLAERLVIHPETLGDAGPEAFDDDVDLLTRACG